MFKVELDQHFLWIKFYEGPVEAQLFYIGILAWNRFEFKDRVDSII